MLVTDEVTVAMLHFEFLKSLPLLGSTLVDLSEIELEIELEIGNRIGSSRRMLSTGLGGEEPAYLQSPPPAPSAIPLGVTG
jgi:hypothetical protein